MTQKPLFYVVFFRQTPPRIAMATPKIPGDQKLFERVSYMLKLKVTKFQLPRANGFLSYITVQNSVKVPVVQNLKIKKRLTHRALKTADNSSLQNGDLVHSEGKHGRD